MVINLQTYCDLPLTELLASTGDYLRLWSVDADNVLKSEGLMNNSRYSIDPVLTELLASFHTVNIYYSIERTYCRHAEYCSPLTSFDWNETDPNLMITCSIDTTCTVWDVEKQTTRTQVCKPTLHYVSYT